MATADLPGFPASTVAGHPGSVRSIRARGGRRVLAFLGRVHGYEGNEPAAVVHAVRTAYAAGCRRRRADQRGGRHPGGPGGRAAGADRRPPQPHRASPLSGPLPPEGLPARFVDLTDAYSPRLRALAREVDPSLAEGVYAGLPGPHYETPAEIRMLRALGADLVGMSTVWETIAARHLGLEVLAPVAGHQPGRRPERRPLDHEEVLEAGRASAEAMGGLLAEVVDRL